MCTLQIKKTGAYNSAWCLSWFYKNAYNIRLGMINSGMLSLQQRPWAKWSFWEVGPKTMGIVNAQPWSYDPWGQNLCLSGIGCWCRCIHILIQNCRRINGNVTTPYSVVYYFCIGSCAFHDAVSDLCQMFHLGKYMHDSGIRPGIWSERLSGLICWLFKFFPVVMPLMLASAGVEELVLFNCWYALGLKYLLNF